MLNIERNGHVATLWLDRPEKRNAMGPEFWDGMPGVMAELGDDPDVRVVLIAGKGKAFTVGLDLVYYGAKLAQGAAGEGEGGGSQAGRRMALRADVKRMQGAITAVADCPKPVIAVVHGWCIGGGVDLITACDMRLASADAMFSVRETKLAIVADVGTLQRLPKIVGPGRVADLVYTGRDVPADEALAMGLVDHVYEDRAALEKAAAELAGLIADNSPLVVQGAKAVLRAGEGRSVAEALDYVATWNAAMLESDDLREAMQAFLEKRPPNFTGR